MRTNDKTFKDKNGVSVDPTLFRSMIGSLLYLTASMPVIYFSVRVCAQYQANPKESHIVAIKKIIKYVNGIADYRIRFFKYTNSGLARYSDAD